MALFVESIWIWVGIACAVAAVGAMFYQNSPKLKTLALTALAIALVLALGVSLNRFVDTDQKSVRRMLDGLIVAIEKDDVEGVLKEYVSPNAEKTQALARANMLLVKISNARYQDLKLEVNNLTSPPVAKTSFTGVVYWKPKSTIDGFSFDTPQLQIVHFDMELEKTQNNSWRVTDNLHFDPQAAP